jgi:hypothetical protein
MNATRTGFSAIVYLFGLTDLRSLPNCHIRTTVTSMTVRWPMGNEKNVQMIAG